MTVIDKIIKLDDRSNYVSIMCYFIKGDLSFDSNLVRRVMNRTAEFKPRR